MGSNLINAPQPYPVPQTGGDGNGRALSCEQAPGHVSTRAPIEVGPGRCRSRFELGFARGLGDSAAVSRGAARLRGVWTAGPHVSGDSHVYPGQRRSASRSLHGEGARGVRTAGALFVSTYPPRPGAPDSATTHPTLSTQVAAHAL